MLEIRKFSKVRPAVTLIALAVSVWCSVPIAAAYATILAVHGAPIAVQPQTQTVIFSGHSEPNKFSARGLVQAVASKPGILLWSSYPASVRGQICNQQPPSNPLFTGGW